MQLPLFDKSTWLPPAQLPDLSNEKIIALDTETYDPRLKELGAGFTRMDGRIIGVSIATANRSFYLPFSHDGGDNLDEGLVISYLRNELPKVPEVVFANATYDLGWLSTKGVSIHGTVRDVQVAESLIDSERLTYKLDVLSKDYLGLGKDESMLDELVSIQPKGFDKKRDMYKMPARFVGTYAEIDARRTFDVYEKQIPILRTLGLWDLWEMECKITKISHRMTMDGVRVDLKAAERLNDELKQKELKYREKFKFDIWTPREIARYCDEIGVSYPRTDKGNPSITKDFMRDCQDSRLAELKEYREINKLRKDFVENGILRRHVKGRIHAQFNQTSGEDESGSMSGTRSGRFSSSNPNLQQVPKRSDIGKRIRGLYIAEQGCLWAKCDYSSQEPRLQVHYALGHKFAGADEARQAFVAGKKLYTFFEETVGLPYDSCKAIFLGRSYGMGVKKMAITLNMDEFKCQQTLEQFDRYVPFISNLNRAVQNKAKQKGYVRSLLGRRMNFDFWICKDHDHSPIKGQKEAYARFMQLEENLAKCTGRDIRKITIERAFVYKALNRLIQGSAADQTKKAMVDLEEAGLGAHLPVHDELNRVNCQNEKEAQLQKEIMEQTIKLNVPVVSDLDLGKGWE